VTTFLYPAIRINYFELLKLLAFEDGASVLAISLNFKAPNKPSGRKNDRRPSVRLARSVLRLFPNGGVETSNKHAPSSETFEKLFEGTKGNRNGKGGIYERP
jgi:hypothetical protein